MKKQPIEPEEEPINLKVFGFSAAFAFLVILLLLATVLLFAGCSTTRMTYKVRNHHNRVLQETIQYQNSVSSGKDWTRPYRNWNRRPQGSWPFEFLQ